MRRLAVLHGWLPNFARFHACGTLPEFGEDRTMIRILISDLIALKDRSPLVLPLRMALRKLGASEPLRLQISISYRNVLLTMSFHFVLDILSDLALNPTSR